MSDTNTPVKVCADCQEEKPFSDFYVRKSRGNGALYSYCKTCTSYRRAVNLHGFTDSDVARARDLYSCESCGDPITDGRYKHMDHCHVTGKFRGILCHYCNVGIGYFRDDVDRLRKAIAYLELDRG